MDGYGVDIIRLDITEPSEIWGLKVVSEKEKVEYTIGEDLFELEYDYEIIKPPAKVRKIWYGDYVETDWIFEFDEGDEIYTITNTPGDGPFTGDTFLGVLAMHKEGGATLYVLANEPFGVYSSEISEWEGEFEDVIRVIEKEGYSINDFDVIIQHM